MARLDVKLSDFDSEPLIEYAITNSDLTNVYHYLQAMQAHLTRGTWADICLGGYYGTSALLHEVVEVGILLIRYRILEERTPDGGWETIGVITHWTSEPPHLQLSGIVHHTVSTSIWRVILERVREHRLTLETYHEAIGEFANDYHLLPEIYEIEAKTAVEIRHQLREKYMYEQQAEPVVA